MMVVILTIALERLEVDSALRFLQLYSDSALRFEPSKFPMTDQIMVLNANFSWHSFHLSNV